MNAIETHRLTRTFGRRDAVRALDLQVPSGSIFAFIGPNGAGKTTTIKLLLNLVRPTSGRAVVLGQDSQAIGPAELQRIGYVSENQELPSWMTAEDLLAYVRPFYPSWDEELVRRLQDRLTLDMTVPIAALSRGNRMKVALLSSLAYSPDLLVLDEPFSGLDPVVRDELVQALLEVARDREWTVLVSSHDVDEVERLADRVAFIADGRLLFAEPVDDLLRRFRRIEIVSRDAAPADGDLPPGWISQGVGGRTARFIDTAHHADAQERIHAAFPDADVAVLPMGLREIFLAVAQTRPSQEAR